VREFRIFAWYMRDCSVSAEVLGGEGGRLRGMEAVQGFRKTLRGGHSWRWGLGNW
jgi:hypothetical protein